jgi:hypothetical protein
MASQEQLEAQLIPEMQKWYRALKEVVKAGNCLFDDDVKIQKIKSVELAAGTKGTVKGIIFSA